MRIAIDATALRPDRTTGVERYTRHVVQDLPSLRRGWDWVAVARADADTDLFGDGVRVLPVTTDSRGRREIIDTPRLLASQEPDLVLFPAFPPPLLPLFRRSKVVVAVHDATYWRFPKTLSTGARFYYKPLLSHHLATRRINCVLTPSQAAKDDLAAHIGPRTPIAVVPLGLDNAFATGPAWDGDGERQDYILATGTIEPRKNYLSLLCAATALRRAGYYVPPIKIVGREGWGLTVEELRRADPTVECLTGISDASLRQLYARARLFVMPSLYEGFGLPLLEAMATGCHCLVSDIGALREVGGDTVAYVAGFDSGSWECGLKQSLSQAAGVTNDAARRRSAQFTWDEWARQTVDVLESL